MAHSPDTFATADITAGSPDALGALGFDASQAMNAASAEIMTVGGQNPSLVAAAMAAIEATTDYAVEAAQGVGNFTSQVLAGRVEQVVDAGISI